jgi:hypothetical protein
MSTPKPRPSQKPRSQAAPRSSGRSDGRTLDLTVPPRRKTSSRPKTSSTKAQRATLDPNDAGVRRRARKKTETRKKNLIIWGITLGLTVIIGGMATGIYARYESVSADVDHKNEVLASLQKQLNEKRQKLSEMSSAVGKERVLVERGFVRDGERLLLFPKDKKDD